MWAAGLDAQLHEAEHDAIVLDSGAFASVTAQAVVASGLCSAGGLLAATLAAILQLLSELINLELATGVVSVPERPVPWALPHDL